MWEISKEFDCCYGHRVWNQTLNVEYSLDNKCVCRHLHGHQMKLIVHLAGDHLHEGMVTDFKHLGWFKKFIDENIDHKFIIDSNDPLFSTLLPDLKCNPTSNENEKFITQNFEAKRVYQFHEEGFWTITSDLLLQGFPQEKQELYEGYVIVPFVPTSENLSKWFFDIITTKMKPLCKVSRVEFFETPKSRSQFHSVD